MSKIPQGEWNAIAARYGNGESISAIARSYGCTPPAIHYILKRQRQSPANSAPLLPPGRQVVTPGRDAAAPPVMPAGKFVGAPSASPSAGLVRASAPAGALAPRADAGPDRDEPDRSAAAVLTPGLDSELHIRAEAAIALFRSSFDAALAEGSRGVRERLRQAASDLMRVAARTTIVLDRLDAGSVRSGRVQNYPRSARTRDDLGKIGPV